MMKLKALGAVVALLAVSVVFAQMAVTRVIARGYALNSNEQRLDFNFSSARMQSGSNTRYLGQGSFRWRDGSTLHSVSLRRVNSMTVTTDDDGNKTIEMSGVAELVRGGSLFGPRSQRTTGAFTLQIVDLSEGDDTIEFSFSAGAGLNVINLNYSGTVQGGSQLNIWTNTL